MPRRDCRYTRSVQRRRFLSALFFALPALAAQPSPNLIRGKLVQVPAVLTDDGRLVSLKGDEPTMGALKDPRVLKVAVDFEAHGHFTSSSEFAIDPIHTRALFAYRDGKKLMITYWCNVCYIRTYTPGKCWCCQ